MFNICGKNFMYLFSQKKVFGQEEEIVKLGDRKRIEGKKVFSFVSDSPTNQDRYNLCKRVTHKTKHFPSHITPFLSPNFTICSSRPNLLLMKLKLDTSF